MSELIDNIWTFKTANFVIKCDALVEYASLTDLYPDDTEKQINQMIESLNNYNSVLFCARVTVETKQGEELACNYLGACHYDDYDSFIDHRGIGYFSALRKYKKAVKSHKWIEADRLRGVVFRIKKQGFCYGSYFSDMVRESIHEARQYWNDKPSVKLKAA